MRLGSRLRSLGRKSLAVLFPFAILSAGCGDGGGSESGAFRVALLSPGPVSDEGWNAAAYEGLRRIETELGASISQQETKSKGDMVEGYREYARLGYDVVIGHGGEYQDAAREVGPSFPNTVFLVTAGREAHAPNVAPLLLELEEAAYVAGWVAARVSGTGRLGCIGGMKIEPIERTFAGFEAGARAARADTVVRTSYVGNWEDTSAAREAAKALIGEGVDVLFHNADAAGLGVFKAAREHEGVLAIGSNKDQNALEPGVVLASAVADVPRVFVEAARAVKEGTFRAEVRRFGLKDGAVSLVYNPLLLSRIPQDVRDGAEAVSRDIRDGKIAVPKK